ncbi:hypothetical protein JCM16303_006118 [Sporobolomyces ruberrimus]
MSFPSLEPRLYRPSRPLSFASSARPLSVASNISAISSSSSITGERRRRSTALLEQELGSNPLEDTPRERSIRSSISRAEEVLRASERQRELERRKERAGLRARQVGHSSRLLEHLDDDTTEELDHYSYDRGVGAAREFNPNRLLRKARSIPSELLMSPPSSRRSISLTQENGPHESARVLSRPASSAAILDTVASVPLTRSNFANFIIRPDYLPVPTLEPTSKFSASSGDSVVDLGVFSDKSPRLRDRARGINQASTNGFKNFGSKFKSKTPSKLNLRKKPSLAAIFRDVDRVEEAENQKPPERPISTSRFRNLSHRASESVSSSAPSADSDSKKRESSRLGFFRSALRDSTGSRPRSTSTVSPSIISNPVSNSSSSDKRVSSTTGSSESSSTKRERKVGWVTKLGRTIRGKNVAAKRAIFEDDENEDQRGPAPIVQTAEKVKVGSPSPQADSTRPPSRIPVTSLFGEKTHQAAPPRPRRPSRELVSSDDTTFYGHRVPNLVRVAEQIQDSGAILPSSAPRVRAKASVPANKYRPAQPSDLAQPTFESIQPRLAPRSSTVTPFANLGLLPAAEIVPSTSLPTRKLTLDTFEKEQARQAHGAQTLPRLLSYSPSTSDDAPSSPSRSFRSPSPARFRDLIPSGTASSPEKNAKGLPVPLDDLNPKSVHSAESPTRRRAALGPEQIICMTDARERSGKSILSHSLPVPLSLNFSTMTGPISQVRGATTDLADLLSGLEDTQDYDRSRSFTITTPLRSIREPEVPPLPVAFRQPLPHFESIESLRSTVSDVPDDLKDLINTVDDHISEVDIPSFVIEGYSMEGRGFADEHFDSCSSSSESDSDSSQDEHFAPAFATDPQFLSVHEQHTNNGFTTSDCATSTTGFDLTVSSFEGHVSTAANVLRDMLEGGLPHLSSGRSLSEISDLPVEETDDETESEEEEGDDQNSLRDSVREALDVARPSAGDRMFDHVDSNVSLSALVDPSLPPSPVAHPVRSKLSAVSFSANHFRHESLVSSSEGSTESTGLSLVHSSPTPNTGLGRPHRLSPARYSQDQRYLNHQARSSSGDLSSISSERESRSNHHANSSIARSSRSTNLSITPVSSSPCPVPRNRRIPMLTHSRPPPLQPSFRFPKHDDHLATIKSRNVDALAGVGTVFVLGDSPGTPPEMEMADDVPLRLSKSSTPPRLVNRSKQCNESFDHDESDRVATPPEPINVSMPRDPRLDGRFPLSPVLEKPSSPAYSEPARRESVDERSDGSWDGYDDVLDSEEDYDFAAQDPETTRKYVHLSYEAETEVRRSQTIWPDTDRSREAVAAFDAPKTYHAILNFLFSSQNRFPNPPHLSRLSSFVPVAFADPPTPPSPVSPVSPIRIPSPLQHSTDFYLASTPPSPEAQPSIPTPQLDEVPLKSSTTQPLRKVLGNKSVNTALSRSTSEPIKEDALSPFTALPPRLGSKLRGIRAKTSPVKKKVDTTFLGDAASRRRQAQFNAAARRLEGTGFPSEQRSDEDTDDTGVLEAKGEATDEFTFTR